jgi:excisionase family DNA binding protein
MNSETSPILKSNGEALARLPEFLTLRQAAEVLQVSTASVRRAYHRGELKAFLLGCSLRIRRTDLETWVESQRWSEALCAERTARPGAGRRKLKAPAVAPAEPVAESAPAPEVSK